MSGEEVRIEAADGYPLAATWYEPAEARAGGVTVVVNSATGVKRGYYDRFARFLSGEGLGVLTYDYRGIGGSAPRRLRGFRATLRDWGERDQAGALAWAAARSPGSALATVGHSFGGQALGLAPNTGLVRAAVLVGAQSGFWGHWPAGSRLLYGALWHAGLPALVALFGRLPMRLAGQGEDLPAGVAREWARWCRSPGYLADHRDEAGRSLAEGHRAFRAPLLSIGFSDDAFAPRAACEALLALFGSAEREYRHLRPADLGQRRVGHFGFFREGVGGARWPEVAEWLRSRALRPSAPPAPPVHREAGMGPAPTR